MPLNGHSCLVSRTWHDNTKEKAGKPSQDSHCWAQQVYFRLNNRFPDLGRLFLALIQPILPSSYWSTIRIPQKATMLIKPYPSQYGVFIKLNYFRYVTQPIYLVIMLISINFNCIREAHDWEVNVFASFFQMLHSVIVRKGGDKQLWWVPSKKMPLQGQDFFSLPDSYYRYPLSLEVCVVDPNPLKGGLLFMVSDSWKDPHLGQFQKASCHRDKQMLHVQEDRGDCGPSPSSLRCDFYLVVLSFQSLWIVLGYTTTGYRSACLLVVFRPVEEC